MSTFHFSIRLVAGFFLALLGVLIFLQVLTRYVFRYPFPWLEEVCGFLFVWICFLGASIALQENAHVSIDLMMERLRPRLRAVLGLFCEVITAGILAVFIFSGIQAAILAHSRLSSSLELPWSIVYAAFPVGMALLFGQIVRLILQGIKKLSSRQPG